MTKQKQLEELYLKNQIRIEQLKSGQIEEWKEFLKKLDRELRKTLSGNNLTDFKRQRLEKQLKKGLKKKATDPALTSFLTTLAVAILKVLVGISALGFMGIGMTSFIAVLGAAGLAVGMALSGTLQNFAGGVIILLLKPFNSTPF